MSGASIQFVSIHDGSNALQTSAFSQRAETISRQATKVMAVSSKLEWRIHQFEKLMKLFKNSQSLVSEQFSSHQAPSIVWELHVYPNGKREEDINNVSFFLRQVGMQEMEPLTTDFQIYTLSGQNSRVSICRDVKDFVHQQGRGKFQISRDKMTSATHADGSILLLCELEFLHPDIEITAKREEDSKVLCLECPSEIIEKTKLDSGHSKKFGNEHIALEEYAFMFPIVVVKEEVPVSRQRDSSFF